jgi:drug/metabolite transporter (DMT)-like permease
VNILFAILLGGLTSSLYALSTSLQALEARRSSTDTALRASLLGSLLKRPLWLAGTVAGLAAWPIQAFALTLASVAVVQPALGLGLIVLLVLGVRLLHERIGLREVGAALAIALAIAALGWAAPPESASFTRGGEVGVAVLLALAAVAPYGLRALGQAGGLATSISAGFAWAAVGLATVLIDSSIAHRHWLAVLGWGAGAAAAGWSGLLAEMTALQTWQATRSIPVVFGLEMSIPAALAPILGFVRPTHLVTFGAALAVAVAGAALLGSSRAVARAAHPLTEP